MVEQEALKNHVESPAPPSKTTESVPPKTIESDASQHDDLLSLIPQENMTSSGENTPPQSQTPKESRTKTTPTTTKIGYVES